MPVVLYVVIAIAVVNVLAVVVIARLGRRLGGSEKRWVLVVGRLGGHRGNRDRQEQKRRAPTHR